MNFKTACFFGLFFIAVNCFSQDKEIHDIRDITKLTILSPGFSYEKRIGKFQSLCFQGFMSISASYSYSSSLGTNSSFHIDPALAMQYRYYYNAAKRQAKEKRTEMNSLNYITAVFETVFSKAAISDIYYKEYKVRPVNTVGLAWGLQRNYKSRFSLDLNLGLGCLFAKSSFLGPSAERTSKTIYRVTVPGQFTWGIWLNKK